MLIQDKSQSSLCLDLHGFGCREVYDITIVYKSTSLTILLIYICKWTEYHNYTLILELFCFAATIIDANVIVIATNVIIFTSTAAVVAANTIVVAAKAATAAIVAANAIVISTNAIIIAADAIVIAADAIVDANAIVIAANAIVIATDVIVIAANCQLQSLSGDFNAHCRAER